MFASKLLNPKYKIVKIVCMILTISLLSEIIMPTVSLAMITNGASQPEVFSYQPVDATDNVSLTTGAFNYTIPITSIPEYPMAISYRSSNKVDEEAGMFGYGFHGFSGAIGRNMMGLPDDLKGATRNYHYENQKRWSASLGATIGVSLMDDIPITKGLEVGAGLSVTITGGYDNYTGAFGSIGFGIGGGLSTMDKAFGPINASVSAGGGLGLSSDSRSSRVTVGGGMGIGIGISVNSEKEWVKTITSQNETLLGVSFSQAVGDKSSATVAASVITSAGITNFSSTASSCTQSLAPLSNVLPINKGWGLSLSVPIPSPAPPISLTVSGSYNQNKLDKNNITKSLFGYQYLGEMDRKNDDNLADFTIEGQNEFPSDKFISDKGYDPKLNPSFLQRDFFVANAMGLGGSMQLNQEEYGVVARGSTRRQYRDIGLLSVKTSRQESFPWKTVDKAVFNPAVDILKLLKGGGSDSDFDNVMFNHISKASLVSPKHTFGKTKFKMRGELSGEFSIASKNYKDNKVNAFDLLKIKGSGGKVKGFLRGGRNVSLFVPVAKEETQQLYDNAGKIETSTAISYQTLGETIEAYDNLINIDPNSNFRFSESFYNHNQYSSGNIDKKSNVNLNDKLASFNLLSHLKDIKESSKSDISSTISSIEVQNVSGIKYIFNLPAYAKETELVMLKGKGVKPPVARGDTYNSFSNKKRDKVKIKDNFSYPYAWMLTAIVGEDYVDFDNVPGPSDGDLGYWVKFKYTKTADNYRWRFPFTGMLYMPNAVTTYGDDSYNMTSGLKEIYVLSEIESSQYVCKYNYQKRFDGLDAKAKVNGVIKNYLAEGNLIKNELFSQVYTGDNFQFAVTSIDLYKKHPEGEHSKIQYALNKPGKIVKTTKFYYDYSTSSYVPNNLANYPNMDIKQNSLSYYYKPKAGENIGTGRLTLRKIQHVAYDSNENEKSLPSYNFSYYSDVVNSSHDYNPAYNNSLRDMWGNYNINSSTKDLSIPGKNNTVKLYHPYCAYDKEIADNNAKVWQLKTINLPSGGKMDINYQAQSYAYVQDKKAYVMRKILGNKDGVRKSIEKYSGDKKYTKVTIDIDDIYREEIKNLKEGQNPKGLKNVVEAGDMLYGEVYFYQSSIKPEPGKQFAASTEVELVEVLNDIFKAEDGRYYQSIVVKANRKKENKINWDHPPFLREVEVYMFNNSEQVNALRQAMPISCGMVELELKKMDNMGKDKPLDALRKAIANFRNVFKPDGAFKKAIVDCYGQPGEKFIEGISFIRTPVYKAKYTGTRVKELTYNDNFHYASQGVENGSNSYGSVYYYDNNSDDSGESAGVATVEPLGGKAMALNTNELVGMGYLPSPAIISSKTTLGGKYENATPNEKGIRSRDKGKTVYEFYSPKDKSLNYLPTDAIKSQVYKGAPKNLKGKFNQFGMLTFFLIKIKVFGKKITIKIPFVLPISLRWRRTHNYKMKSYSYVDYTDIYGRPKSIVQMNSGGITEGKQEFKYYGVDEGIPVYKEKFNGTPLLMRPGKVDQVWSEAWYSKETDLSLIPWILFFNAKTYRNHNYINMKYSYVPPIMKEVITSVDGQKTITHNSGFDYYTGTPIEVKSKDSYGNVKIKRTVPAYWKYSELGPVYKNPNNLNKLTAKTASYLYLNKTDDEHILGASVTRWDKDDWNVIDYLQPNRSLIENQYHYEYSKISGDNIKKAYNSTDKTKDKYIKRNSYLYKPVETYTYEVGLKDNGTFKSFTDFNYNGGNNDQWKMVSKSELYDANGVLVQASDILNKNVSQHMGYNSSKAISVVANASYKASYYDGAENTYLVNNKTVLELDRIKLGDTYVLRGNCDPLYNKYFLNSENYLTGDNAKSVKLINISKPDKVLYNKQFAGVRVVFENGLKRVYFISIDEMNRYNITSNLGEDFTGFIVLPDNKPNDDAILFDWNRISNIEILPLNNNYDFKVTEISKDLKSTYASCTDFPEKNYQMPEADCIDDVHTGDYAFVLEGGGEGTIVELKKADIGENEYNRKYKAMVWVNGKCPEGSQLVIRYTSVNNAQSETVITPDKPYAVSGNWKLLRCDFETKDPNGADTKKVEVFMRNTSSMGLLTYDDFRVLPYHAEMSNYVFNHRFNWVTSTIDADNFATYNQYDSRGRVINSSVEIDGLGKKTIKQMMYGDQKQE